MRKLLTYLALALLACPLGSMAQTDTVFWFALPPTTEPGRFVFHTYDQPAVVTVTQPANPYWPLATFSMPAHNCTFYTVSPSEYAQSVTDPYNTVFDRGYCIKSTAPVTCYYQIASRQRETFTLKGRNALGTDFQVLAPIQYRPNSPLSEGQCLTMIATADSTRVRIIAPTWVNTGSIALLDSIGRGDSVTVTLNRGQSYSVRSPRNISGILKAKVQASAPIAISFSDNAMLSRTVATGVNPAGEQLLPLTHWGTEYVMINSFTESELFRSTDYVDTGTYRVWTNGSGFGRNSGGMDWNVGWANFYDSVNYIVTERPLGMMHQQAPYGQMAATVVPQLEGSGSHQISYLHADSTRITVNMVIPTHATGDVLFNNSATVLTAASFRPLPGRPDMSWCSMDVSPYVPGGTVMTVKCSVAKFVLAVIETDTLRGTAYTYLTDYAPAGYVRFVMDTVYCEGDSIVFHCRTAGVDSVALHCPDGRTLTATPFVVAAADSTDGGLYTLEGYDTVHNVRYTDSIYIRILQRPASAHSDTVYDSQLPWVYHGHTFLAEADTVFVEPTAGLCDSLHHYTLHVLRDVHDTVWYYLCQAFLPLQTDSVTLDHEGTTTVTYHRDDGTDSVVTYVLHLIPDSDTAIADTIVESQLPWLFGDTLFYDSVADCPFVLVNEAGCDSVVHYSLVVYWESDHCDTTLAFPAVVTPNADGVNDRFVIEGLLENNCFRFNDLVVYDRTGRVVFRKHNIAAEDDWWDPASPRMPAGTYFYVFKAHGITIHTMRQGIVEVLR